MSTFENIKKGIPNKITLPIALKKLCEWTEQNGYPISGCFELRADDGQTMDYWTGYPTDKNLTDRLGFFGVGSTGDLYGFWIDKAGNQKIIYLSTEGGGERYVLANNFVDFLRLLAIGYDEIGWADMNKSPEEWNVEQGLNKNEGINPKFREWVEQEFQVKTPKKGAEIADFDNKEFYNWTEEQIKRLAKNRAM